MDVDGGTSKTAGSVSDYSYNYPIVSYDNCKLKIQTKVLFMCPDIGKIQQQCVWVFFSFGIAFEWKMATIMSKNELLVLVTINVDCCRILRSVHVFN